MWSLHIIPVHACIYWRCSSFLPQSKDMLIGWNSVSQFALLFMQCQLRSAADAHILILDKKTKQCRRRMWHVSWQMLSSPTRDCICHFVTKTFVMILIAVLLPACETVWTRSELSIKRKGKKIKKSMAVYICRYYTMQVVICGLHSNKISWCVDTSQQMVPLLIFVHVRQRHPSPQSLDPPPPVSRASFRQ